MATDKGQNFQISKLDPRASSAQYVGIFRMSWPVAVPVGAFLRLISWPAIRPDHVSPWALTQTSIFLPSGATAAALYQRYRSCRPRCGDVLLKCFRTRCTCPFSSFVNRLSTLLCCGLTTFFLKRLYLHIHLQPFFCRPPSDMSSKGRHHHFRPKLLYWDPPLTIRCVG
jgi:hypothetical protein